MNKLNLKPIYFLVFALIVILIKSLLPVYYFNAGGNYLKKGEYVKAYRNLKTACSFNPGNSEYRYYYVQSMSKLKPTLTIQKEVFQIASGGKSDSAQLAAENKVSEWRQNALKTIGDNYIEQTPLNNGIVRWDANKFPLKVSIIDESGINLPPYYLSEIQKAFKQWEVSTNFIKFTQTDKQNDIVIKILPLPKNSCSEKDCKYVVGFTVPEIKNNILKKMVITLYAQDPHGNFFSDKEIFNTILHETGHALGIMGHSYSMEDLMYMTSDNSSFYAPYRSTFQYLSSKDINTIKLLYKLVPNVCNTPIENLDTKNMIYAPIILGTSEDIAERKLKEAHDYIKKAPNLPGGYIDLGIAYSDLNKYKEASKAFQKAYLLSNTQSDKYIACYNLSAVHLNNKKFNEALKFALEAQQISDTEEIKELIAQINNAKK